MSGILDGAMADPDPYLGPLVLGPFFQAIFQGMLIDMTWTYYTKGKSEHMATKILVAFLCILALVQSGAALYQLWATFVMGFGDWLGALSFKWPEKVQTVYQATMTAPVQGYYIWRCWKVTESYFVLAPLCALLLSSWAVAVNVTYRVFHTNFAAQSSSSGPVKIPVDAIFIYWVVSAAVLDVAITAILLTYLLKSKSKSHFKGMNSTINKLLFVLWQTAIPPCACALTICITYIAMIKSTTHYVDLFFQEIMGKLYVISLMVTLNARIGMNESRNGTTIEMGPFASQQFKSTVRVDVHTMHELDETRSGGGVHVLPLGTGAPMRKVHYDDFDIPIEKM